MATTKKAKKEEGDKPKKAKSSSKKKEKTEKAEPPPPEPEPSDPDAIQLFRRYDREKLGHITRDDFMQLLADYNASHPQRKWEMAPCALTDAAGIPLGFERTSRNSEFEAGQLFERYDTDRSGTLNLKEFHGFIRDFKKQLVPFVEELTSPRAFKHSGRPPPSFPLQDGPAWSTFEPHRRPPPPSTHQLFESRLEQLNTMCDNVLLPYRATLMERMSRRTDPALRWAPATAQTTKQQMELDQDIDLIDRITSSVHAKRYKGDHISSHEMHEFLDEFPHIYAAAEELAQKAKAMARPIAVYETPAMSDETTKLLRVKDQMIWDLLQERKELRHQRDALEHQLRDVTELSAQEMRKWAKLTDDMQAEIERLRRE
ncbi:hypothetical protein SDRG_02122 [Saprolegnia diclina VS20]|uniref:EF-hand domain-containing protein n=1 Tax=Saprolegnia diclina (strain VS20) TaxID=1156394 RepID=T0S7K2_SAPDV|nr:hypothetical protein SDRG_02122 [Saprolegnia diclina VS20]EQC41068.1 hypothetical protein SDRG_02122 [Saprolegnia diclina VS20]|eukprot:XP_008605912.1 hypothetical protein SDRG_02122 [Saprolegnia diclina VS20]